MINSKTSLAAILALGMSGITSSAAADLIHHQIGNAPRARKVKNSTFGGQHNPAGTKLARMADKGQIGINKIR